MNKFKADFVVEDLSLMDTAVNYNRWLYSLIASWLSGSVLEIGSGIGNITIHILNKSKNVELLTCIELNANCCEYLRHQSSLITHKIDMDIVNTDFMDMQTTNKFDAIFSFNVLEHIEDDVAALCKMKDLLYPGGRVLCFVPAIKWLYGSIDKKVGHRRRYSKRDLVKKIVKSGLSISNIRYYNTIGLFGWFLNNRILRIQSQKPKQIALFDKYIFPLQRDIESLVKMPFGQNLFFVAHKQG
ncbi:MAG: class I SAM-dependent methyltransferase [bacterium]